MVNKIDMPLLIKTIHTGIYNRIERILRNPGATCFTVSSNGHELVFEYADDGELKDVRAKSLEELIPLAEKALYMKEEQ